MKRYLRLNSVLESLVEYFIVQHLRADNPHVDEELVYDHKIIIHSVEMVDDDIMVANVEHALCHPVTGVFLQPNFTKVELTPSWPSETVFNIEWQE